MIRNMWADPCEIFDIQFLVQEVTAYKYDR